LMSEAEIIEAINADSLISVSLGAGQPQKNVKMSTLASVAAELMGLPGISIRKKKNTNNTAGKVELFSGCTDGIVFIKNNSGDPVGRCDAIIFIIGGNTIRVQRFNEGSDSHYHKFSISNGVLSVGNSGYGVGVFTAYWLS